MSIHLLLIVIGLLCILLAAGRVQVWRIDIGWLGVFILGVALLIPV
jgi:hypothetical protein